MNGWTEERKQRQRELIQNWKPWLKSTGARTAKGKAKVAKNAIKSGNSLAVRELIKELNGLFKGQKKTLK